MRVGGTPGRKTYRTSATPLRNHQVAQNGGNATTEIARASSFQTPSEPAALTRSVYLPGRTEV